MQNIQPNRKKGILINPQNIYEMVTVETALGKKDMQYDTGIQR